MARQGQYPTAGSDPDPSGKGLALKKLERPGLTAQLLLSRAALDMSFTSR